MLNEIFQSIDPVAFSVFGMPVRWYGIAYVLGFICAGFLVWALAKKWKVDLDGYDVVVLICFASVGLLLCARFFYCIFYGDGYYFTHPIEVFAVSRGGMSFHGGLVGALLGGFIYSRIYHIPLLTLADLTACAAPIGLLFGRCANFINGELYGAVTDLPIGVDFLGTGIYFHPSQLYEAALEGLVLFVVMIILALKSKPLYRGAYLGVFLTLYSIFRFSIEFVRLPDAQIGYFFGNWGTMGQALCVPMFICGIILLVYAYKKRLPQSAYKSRYSDTIEEIRNDNRKA